MLSWLPELSCTAAQASLTVVLSRLAELVGLLSCLIILSVLSVILFEIVIQCSHIVCSQGC